ncbi:hypothetical protein BC834DRAFT_696808 [Gloeopeniophorella convolvens]|nr:hypothetical protein BC834DRAFT_696808 [Gloeopeniophorella convolvens]
MSKASANTTAHLQKQFLSGLTIFNPSLLATKQDVATAVNVLEGTLDGDSIGPILQCALQSVYPYTLEFIICAVGKTSAVFIFKHILDQFPSDADGYSSSSTYSVLSRLTSGMHGLPYPGEKPDGLDDHYRHMQKAPAVLGELCKLINGGLFDDAEEIQVKSSKRNGNRFKQSKPSRSKAATGAEVEILTQCFYDFSLKVPRNRDAANEMVESIFSTQKRILKFFFTLARRPEIARLIREAYLRGGMYRGSVDAQSTLVGQHGSNAGAAMVPSIPEDGPFNIDLFIDSAEGFGKWRVYCSKACLSVLARDKEQSRYALDKLKELSTGCFSKTNQKRLTRDSPVDIFRARLPGEWRLVYHIDVVKEPGRDYENQVLRVLGVYTLHELKRKNWDKIGAHRAKKGKVYTDMCRARCPCPTMGPEYFEPVASGVSLAPASPPDLPDDVRYESETERDDIDEVHRMMDLEQYSVLSQDIIRDILEGENHNHVFQLSREEGEVAEYTGSSFVLGRSGTGKTTIIVLKMFGIERGWQNGGCVGPRPRQIFVTKSSRLAEKVEEDYVNFLYSLSSGPGLPDHAKARVRRWRERKKNSVVDVGDSVSKREDLPDKFSKLGEADFPVFMTFDTLCTLLEADLDDSSRSDWNARPRHKKWTGDQNELVTFDVFKRDYWPRISNTSAAAPSVAFSEFIGNIKGSEKSLEFPNRMLDRDAYENHRNRHMDYSLFEVYQRLKRELGARDHADRTHDILRKLDDHGLKGEMVDFVYVDEVQDLLLIDARLLISLCRNQNGFLWAGDTAQTISVGSTFTFTQLGAAVWRYQRNMLQRAPRQPQNFQLLVNYRSHGGIVRCANAIVDILRRFPGAIDELRPEASVPGKELPVFFSSEQLPSSAHGFFSVLPGVLVKLGSQQCIIVRDEAARIKVKEEIGRPGTILTVFGSKGLEYDDVILYNFFEDSVKDNLWRHLFASDSWQDLADPQHTSLIHELKCLYVAITRARHRLWVVNQNGGCFWLQRYLLGKGLIKEASTEQISTFAKESTSEEWAVEGRRLLAFREFEEARSAFEAAGDTYMSAVAEAYRLQEVALDIPSTSTKARRDAFVPAATLFEQCAAMADHSKAQANHHHSAARCYAKIKYHQDVVRNLKLASMYTDAATYCFDNNLLDQSVSITRDHKDKMDPAVKERITQVARFSYLESKRLDDAAELFEDKEEQMEFLVEHDLGEARALVLEKDKDFGKAIQGYLEEGLLSAALELFDDHILEVSQDSNVLRSFFTVILWEHFSFGCRSWEDVADVSPDRIFRLLSRIPRAYLKVQERNTVDLFKLMLKSARPSSFANFVLLGSGLDKALGLMALDFLFDDIPAAIDTSSQSSLISSLQLLHRYSALIREAALHEAPWSSESWLPLLFQFRQDGEGIRVKPRSFLYTSEAGSTLSREDFSRTLQTSLFNRLRTRVEQAEKIIARVSIFDLCMQMVLHGRCHVTHEGVVAHELGEGWYNRRIRFHLLRIMVSDNLLTISVTDDFPSRIRTQRTLLHAFESALNPLLHLSGSAPSFNEERVWEASQGLSTVKRWALDVLYSLNPSRQELQGAFLTNLCKAFAVGTIHCDGQTAIDSHLHRLPCATSRRQWYPRLVIRRPKGPPIHALHNLLAFLDGTGDLHRGVTFLCHLVFERIPIDLAVLCGLVERIFGLTILIAAYQRTGTLHSVILPKSWMIALWEDFNRFKYRGVPPIMMLGRVTERLFNDVYTGQLDYLHPFYNRSKDFPSYRVQDVVLARM